MHKPAPYRAYGAGKDMVAAKNKSLRALHLWYTMAKVLVIYDSRTGNTESMAQAVGEGAKNSGIDVEIKRVAATSLNDLMAADGIIMGSPTHFGTMSEHMKALIGRSDEIFGKLAGKIGAAFTSCGEAFCGAETTLLSITCAMMNHGMLVLGSVGMPYGVACVEAPDEKALNRCRNLGKAIGDLVG